MNQIRAGQKVKAVLVICSSLLSLMILLGLLPAAASLLLVAPLAAVSDPAGAEGTRCGHVLREQQVSACPGDTPCLLGLSHNSRIKSRSRDYVPKLRKYPGGDVPDFTNQLFFFMKVLVFKLVKQVIPVKLVFKYR